MQKIYRLGQATTHCHLRRQSIHIQSNTDDIGRGIKHRKTIRLFSSKFNLYDQLAYWLYIRNRIKEGRLDIYYRITAALNVSLDEFVIDSISANTTIFEYNFNVMYKSFGKTRKDMLLNFMNYLECKKEYDRNDDENI